MTDKQPTLTAAELRAIGERVDQPAWLSEEELIQAYQDRARLYAVLERLIEFSLGRSADGDKWCVCGMPGDLIWYDTKDAAIDALLLEDEPQ